MPSFSVTTAKQNELNERMRRLGVTEGDLYEQFIRSSGPGGQKVNKSSSCVYLVHTPTGLAVKCQKVRSQTMNRFYARRLLLDKIERMQKGVVEEEQQRIMKAKRQKHKRRRRAQEKVLADKRKQKVKKQLRSRVLVSLEE